MARKRNSRSKPNATGRNETRQYFTFPYFMAQHEAFRSLSGAAVKVYIELRCRFNGGNNGELSLSLEEGARLLGLGKATVQRALKELEDKGFIVRTRQGQWYGRMASLYAVTSEGSKGRIATNAWKHVRPAKTDFSSDTDPYQPLYGPN